MTTDGVRLLRRNAVLRRTLISESAEPQNRWIWIKWMDERAGVMVPEKVPRSASQPPAVSNEAMTAVLCFKRPERAYIAFDRSCLDERTEGERQDRTVGSGSRARHCDSDASHARGKVRVGVFREKNARTAFWAAGLFCRAVPITHNV